MSTSLDHDEAASRLDAAQHAQPAAWTTLSRLREDATLRNSIDTLLLTVPDYIERAAPVLAAATALMSGDGEDGLEGACAAVIEYTHIYLRHQVRFLASGRYSNDDFETVRREVYDNAEFMRRTYLPGLLLTQVVWPIHLHIQDCYREAFLARLDGHPPAHLLEVGVGHGLTLSEALDRFPAARATALDVSSHSLAFARSLLGVCGQSAARVEFRRVDITAAPLGEPPLAGLATMGEVLEHVADPAAALTHLRAGLVEGALAFLTTVIDSNALDHIQQFESAAEIDALIEAHGFARVDGALVHPADLTLDASPGNDPTRYYWAVVQAR